MRISLQAGELTGLNRSLVLGETFINNPEEQENFRYFRQQIQARAIELPDSSVELELSNSECQTILQTLDKVCQHKSQDFDSDFLVDGNTMQNARKLRDLFSSVD